MTPKLLNTEALKDLKIMVCRDHDVYDVHHFTVETNMKTGEAVIILVPDNEPTSIDARDYEPHPAFDKENAWLFEE